MKLYMFFSVRQCFMKVYSMLYYDLSVNRHFYLSPFNLFTYE